MRRFFGALALAVAAAIGISGCGSSAPTTPTAIPDSVQATETFGGNLTSGGSLYHLVQARAGEVTLTLKGVSNPDLALGMEIGVYSTLSCTAVMQNPKAVIGNSLVGLTTSQTTLCIRMYDPGTLPADGSEITYEIAVKYMTNPS